MSGVIQTLGLPVVLLVSPIAGMTSDAVAKLVVPKILCTLVGIPTSRSRSSNESQADGVVIRFVRSILAVCENGRTKLAAQIG